MYILILNNPKKVIGYTVWTGFGPGGSITDSFDDVAIQNFEKNEKASTVRIFSTKDYAYAESKRISIMLNEKEDKKLELDIMPLQVYINHLERWK